MAFNKYVVPHHIFVGRGEETERLYQLEEERSKAIKACANEFAELFKWPTSSQWDSNKHDPSYYRKTLPQVLFDTLVSYDRGSGIAAAVGYLLYEARFDESVTLAELAKMFVEEEVSNEGT